MPSRPAAVTTELQVSLVVPGATALPVRAGLRYDAADPYAVRISFRTGRGPDAVEWTFARQLLTDGVTCSTGEGDVRVWPCSRDGEPAVSLSLSSPSGSALFELPLPELVEFLTMTYTAVPSGSEPEHVDLEAELEHLLRSTPEA